MFSSSTEGRSSVGVRFVASVAGPCHDIRETPRPDGEGPGSRFGDPTSATIAGGVSVTFTSWADCGGSDGSGDVSGDADDDGCCCCSTAGGVVSLDRLASLMGLGRSSS